MPIIAGRAGAAGLGLLAVIWGVYIVVVGRAKWNPQKILYGKQARLVGLGFIVGGLAMAAFGLLFPDPLWDHFATE